MLEKNPIRTLRPYLAYLTYFIYAHLFFYSLLLTYSAIEYLYKRPYFTAFPQLFSTTTEGKSYSYLS